MLQLSLHVYRIISNPARQLNILPFQVKDASFAVPPSSNSTSPVDELTSTFSETGTLCEDKPFSRAFSTYRVFHDLWTLLQELIS